MCINLKPMLVLFFLITAITLSTAVAKDLEEKYSETLTEKHYQDFQVFLDKLDKGDLKARAEIIKYYQKNIHPLEAAFYRERSKRKDPEARNPIADRCRKLYQDSYLDSFNAQYTRAQKQRDDDRKTTPSLPVVVNPIELLFQLDVPPSQSVFRKIAEIDRREKAQEEEAERILDWVAKKDKKERTASPKRQFESASFASEPFGAYLKTLNPEDIYSATLALERYKTDFKDTTETQRVLGYQKLRIFIGGIYATTMTNLFQHKLYSLLDGSDDPYGKQITPFEQECFLMDDHFLIHEKRILDKYSWRLTGGYEDVATIVNIRPDLYVRAIGDMLPAHLRDYLIVEDKELVSPIERCDGYVDDDVEKCGRRAREWEEYLEHYPDSEYKEHAINRFNFAWRCFFVRLAWEQQTDVLLPNIKAAYEKYIKENGNTPSGKKVQQIYEILKSNNFKWDESFKERYKAILGFEPWGPNH
ncbi:TPA: hypothetical protein DDW35_13325 [Candidatus Sumerlaeota bacterium]|jgi:hypothetical protein|nr:hypothetical protein [Candidatus Sumerlaeota bacterium]